MEEGISSAEVMKHYHETKVTLKKLQNEHDTYKEKAEKEKKEADYKLKKLR